jgi:hypothetical protein
MKAVRIVMSRRAQRRARRILFQMDRPRRIDRYIDFFGGTRRRLSPALALRRRFDRVAYSEAS